MAREITPLAGLRENLILQEDKILQAWMALVPPESVLLAESLADPVRDLVLLMYEYLSGAEAETETDARHIAYRIAQQVLEEHEYQTLIQVFRDAVQEAAVDYTTLTDGESARGLIAFFTTITDAYWLAYSDRLREAVRRQYRDRRRDELRVAKRVQKRLLPKVIPQIPGWEIAGRLVPALEVGGDYWSVKQYANDGVITCKLADVTGHGIGAAILVAAVKFISGGFYRGAPSAAWVMERTNHVLVVETPSDIMVTMVYTWIRPDTGQVAVVNAGHAPVFTCRDGQVRTLPPTGPALGLLESRYSEVELQFHPGDILFFCSDGITEARSRDLAKAREMFGTERLHEVVCGNAHLPAGEIADRVVQTAIDFSGSPKDDMSLVVIKRVSDHETKAPAP